MASMYYRELEPAPALRAFVTCYWEFAVRDLQAETYNHVIMPDGCVSLVYGRPVAYTSAGLHLVGPRLDSFTVPVQAGDIYWGIRLWPGTAGCLLSVAPRAFYKCNVDAHTHLPEFTATLLDNLSGCEHAEDAASVFDATLLRAVPHAKTLDAQVIAGVQAIVTANGEIKIGALAKKLGLSERQFQRRFQEAVGLTPKQFARIRRFRTSLSNVLKTEPKDWTWVAAEQGYADQPHLIREFSQLVGESPTTFAERIRAIEHGPVDP